jgi:hypothetical protein
MSYRHLRHQRYQWGEDRSFFLQTSSGRFVWEVKGFHLGVFLLTFSTHVPGTQALGITHVCGP